MHRLFISFNRQDREKVFKIKKQIESAFGEKCWMDLEDIERGDFAQQTLHAIEQSYFILFFYSKNSEDSQWQRRELEYAIQNNKTIIPLLIDIIPNDSWYYHHLNKDKIVWTGENNVIPAIQKAIKENKHSVLKACCFENLSSLMPLGYKFLIIILVLLIAVISFWLLGFLSPSAPESVGPQSSFPDDCVEYPDTACADSFIVSFPDDCVEYPDIECADSCIVDSIACDSVIESIDAGFNYEEDNHYTDYDFKDISVLPVSELELEALRIQYIIDSLKIANNTEEALYKCHKYQYEIKKELYGRKSADSDVTSLENNKETESDNFRYLWIILVLPLLTIGVYYKRKRSIGNTKQDTKMNAFSPNQSNVALFSHRKEIKIFIAGSIRLVKEREALRATISKMYNQHKNDNLVIEAYEFDDFTREYVEGGQQALYDNFIRNEANWVVFITDGTVGDKTLWELENAITVHKETGRPKILMYSVSQNITDNQKEQMSQFKSVLIRENNYWIDYDDVNTIRSTFREHLEWDLINLMKQELRRVG